MALIYKATLTPSKIELLNAWLPSRPWSGGADDATLAGAYRFDDPAGEVGIESFLLETGDGTVLHVPATYRAEPLAGAEDYLIGTTEHSVLGTRWVYDGCGDPVWAAALATAVLTGGTQVEELVQTDGALVPRDPTATVLGSGTPGTPVPVVESVTTEDAEGTTTVRAPALNITVARAIAPQPAAAPAPTLTARWAGSEAVVAWVSTVQTGNRRSSSLDSPS